MPAYQTSLFAYQGAGQFAYQEQAGIVVVSPAGVKRHPQRVIRLRDIENRQQTADFIKAQLKERHPDLMVREARQPSLVLIKPDVARAMEAETPEHTRKKISDDQAAIAAILASLL